MQAHRLALLTAILLYGSSAEVPTVKDLDGRPLQPISDAVTVLIFTRSDCPVANRYAPELLRIAKRTQGAGVRFLLVYVDPKQSVDAIRAHITEYDYPFRAVLDPRHELVRFARATTTPEVAVFKGRDLVYRGRIDNRHVAAGTTRSEASIHDLDETLTRVLAGESMKFRSTRAVGCYIEDLR